MRERDSKKRKRKGKKISQEDQILELTFDFPLGTFNLSFPKMNSPCSPKEKKNKKKEKKKKKNRGEMRRKKRKKEKRKAFVCAPI